MSFGVYTLNVSDFLELDVASKQSTSTLPIQGFPNYSGTLFNSWELYTATGGSNIDAGFLVPSEELGDATVGQYVKHIGLSKYSKYSI